MARLLSSPYALVFSDTLPGEPLQPMLKCARHISLPVAPAIACLCLAMLGLAMLAPPAFADTLQLPPGTPLILQIAAALLLWLHIGGGAAGIVTGAAAIATRKGGKAHRMAGKIFFVVMLVCYAIAAGVSPFLETGQRPNLIAAIMSLYLLLTGWAAAQRPEIKAGPAQYLGLAAALSIAGTGLLFMQMGAADPTGTVDGTPPQAFVIFTTAGAFAAAGELHILIRGSLSGSARRARHLWRMCFSLFIAAGSFFFGQQKIMPEWIQGSPVLLVLGFAPGVAMIVWLFITLRPRQQKAAREMRVASSPSLSKSATSSNQEAS
jgi:uncharacterized membrane protein